MLRPYQSTLKAEIYAEWRKGNRNVAAVMPTGAGKTVVMADISGDQQEPLFAIAHRQELVSQISQAHARAGIYHRIVAPMATIKLICARHVEKFGQTFYHANAPVAVAGVDTLIRRTDQLAKLLKQAKHWQTDEGHHLLIDNKWGDAVKEMPNANGVGWTATPVRSDRRSLKFGNGGLYHSMVIGPTMGQLIGNQFLTPYRVYGPKSDIDLSGVKITASGDYSSKQLSVATHRSHIVGDIVQHYLRIARGKRGVTFAVDVEHAQEIARAFNDAGVPAAVLHAKTPNRDRDRFVDGLESGRLLQIVNVDVLGEGFDCPAIEVVSMARPTASYGLYIQQFGRALRIMAGKAFGIIIDHVGNIERHKLPDRDVVWTLDTPVPQHQDEIDLPPLRTCPNPDCLDVFEGWSRKCPSCGFLPPPTLGTRPEHVEGNLMEYTPEMLAALRGEVARVESPVFPELGNPAATIGARRRMESRVEAQATVRDAIAWWAGVRRDVYGDEDEKSYRRFYRTFGLDVLSAQALPGPQAEKLAALIWDEINSDAHGRQSPI